MKKSQWILSLLVMTLAACASSGPKVVVDSGTQPGVKLKDFQTWNFIQPLGTDSGGKRSPLSSKLMNSMMVEMDERGLRRSSNSPDLLVDFVVVGEADSGQTPETSSLRRPHWDRDFSTWSSYQATAAQYAQGTLVIDLLDTENSALVGEGAVEESLGSIEITQTRATQLVHEIMKDLW